MTPEEIQQAVARASGIVRLNDQCCENEAFLARAVLTLTEQQPEPVSRDEITDMFESEFADAPTYVVVEHLLSRYTITARPVASPSEEAQRG